MKKFLSNNLLMKIISLFAAVFIWVLVAYNLNPESTKTITVPVQLVNKDQLKAKGMTIVGDDPTVEIEVKARLLDIGKITASDFVVEADMNKLYGEDEEHKRCNLEKRNPVNNANLILSWDPKSVYIDIDTEPLIERKFAIVPISDNVTLAPDFMKGKVTVSPSEITIRGRRSDVSRIYQAVVYISGQDVNEGFTENYIPVLVDEKMNELKLGPGNDLTSIDPLTSTVTATVPVMLSKSLNVLVKPTGTPADGYFLREATSSREKVNVIGPKEDLKSISEIVLDPDISNLSGSKTESISLTRYLISVSENIKLAENESDMITVELNIDKKPKKLYRFDKIEMENKNPLYEYTMQKDAYEIEVEFESDQVDKPQTENIRVSIDVAGMQIGDERTFSPVIELPEGCTLLRKDDVTILVSEKTTPYIPPIPETEAPTAPPIIETEAPTPELPPETEPETTEPVIETEPETEPQTSEIPVETEPSTEDYSTEEATAEETELPVEE